MIIEGLESPVAIGSIGAVTDGDIDCSADQTSIRSSKSWARSEEKSPSSGTYRNDSFNSYTPPSSLIVSISKPIFLNSRSMGALATSTSAVKPTRPFFLAR
jgi:hypothetical protein